MPTNHIYEDLPLVALWEGGSKWDVTPEGKISVCSLKKLVASYIAENLGRVCNVVAEDKSIVMVRNDSDVNRRESGNERTRNYDMMDLNNCESNVSGSSLGLNNSANNVVDIFLQDSGSKQSNLTKTIPYSVFNITSYGKIYAKTDSINIPGDDSGRKFAYRMSRYGFEFRYLTCQ